MKVKFTKMHGCGNDYIYLDCINDNIKINNPEELAKKLSDRHFGIGSDGLVLILSSNKADFKMRMFNSDGSEGNMCGNAVRCIAKYIYEKNHTLNDAISIETLSGIKYIKLKIKDDKVLEIEVDMGKAILETKSIPLLTDKSEFVSELISIDKQQYNVTCVSMGNPHCVVLMDNINELNINDIGPKFENYRLFPNRTNTEFIKLCSKNKLIMRVWERGSGETLACGTGACAAVVACVLNRLCEYDKKITVVLKGGKLKVIYSKDGRVTLIGPAEFVFSGEFEI
jgi:diaminopimelate epimerase